MPEVDPPASNTEVPDPEAASAARRPLLDAAAHELRTPLTVLRGATQLAGRRVERAGTVDPAELRALLGRLDRQTRRLSQRVELVLSAMRLGLAWMPLRRQREDVRRLLEQAVADAQATTADHPVRLRAPARALCATVDALRLEQVFLAVLDNAIKFSADAGPIDVELRPADAETMQISVRDYGVGVAEADHERIFERFYQGEAGARGAGPAGYGLGLYVARALVQAHGGAIALERPAIGGGTRVVLRLPLVPPRR
jgi:signal transduction histidine kinase